jgi:FAD/FMN-containing dehydrogenase
MHGLALDFIEGATVVLADGSIVEASSTKNSDLLWGIKGAGSNFGIVASWKLRTFESPKVLTRFGLTLGWNKTNAVAGLEAVEAYIKDKAPREVNFRVADYGGGGPGIEGLYYGTNAQWRSAFEPLLKTLPAGYNITNVQTVNWLESVISYSNYDNIDWIVPSPVRLPVYFTLSS